MQLEELSSLLSEAFPGADVDVESDGSHFNILIVSDAFEGIRAVKKQQMVYAVINDHIANGSMHAVNMRLHTPAQWAELNS
ncbi:Acid stress protein IbaG [BD1-7 clade bacterium]|uniref:Acid stress protein IbaG n=1 Tax=BD1-7 clade bacterium TaxID=2029982 RepID=A0A5S9N1V5_9GAMM|nr:Acid stress protein IbaG [BD1-7 clade bacterium]CAA0114527.1 Acid stress protein IbaG [BD1-7 clade bacterium]CAA0115480.1 Acid stress protein IbaG [BD1-7 clade bacterium]